MMSDSQKTPETTYLSIAGLEAQMEETPNAVLGCSWGVVEDKAKASTTSVICKDKTDWWLTLCTSQCLGQ